MAIRLAFVDSNDVYAEKLTAWIYKFMPYQFSIDIFTMPQSFEAWVKDGGRADCIIVSVDLFNNVHPFLPKDGVLILDDGSHRAVSTEAPRILKYRPAEEIVKDILSLCADRLPKMHARDVRNSRTTLISNVGGADAIYPAAPFIAYLLSRKGRKVLYASLEQNQITDLYFSGSGNRGLNEMLYYIKSNKDNLSMRLETCAAKDENTGIEFLKAPPGLLPPGDMEAGDIDKLLSAADERNVYDDVVLVADSEINEKFIYLLKKADRIVLVSTNTAGSCLKLKRLFDALSRQNLDFNLLIAKMHIILIKLSDYYGFNEQFPEINKAYVTPNAIGAAGTGWMPADSDLIALNAVVDDLTVMVTGNERK